MSYVKKLGADEVIDFEKDSFQGRLHDYDAVFDTRGGDVYAGSFSVLKKGEPSCRWPPNRTPNAPRSTRSQPFP